MAGEEGDCRVGGLGGQVAEAAFGDEEGGEVRVDLWEGGGWV